MRILQVLTELDGLLKSYQSVNAAPADRKASDEGTGRPGIPASEVANRKDLRGTRIFSIDPTTARDLDDALSVTPLPNPGKDGLRQYRVGVHIADVAFYVRPATKLVG